MSFTKQQGLGEHIDVICRAAGPRYIAENFGKYTSIMELSRFICRYELMKKILSVKGSIVECGVRTGSGLLQWMKLSMLLEPNAHLRTIIGFDTFEGFPSVGEHDYAKAGDMRDDSYFDILNCVELQKSTVQPWDKVKVVKGDFMQTGAEYLAANKHLVVALLYLDFDLYQPTKAALQLLRSKMPKGAIIVFDELNNHRWPGETIALTETLGIHNLRIEKFPFDMNIAWAEL